MTILDRIKNEKDTDNTVNANSQSQYETKTTSQERPEHIDSTQDSTDIELQFKRIMAEFQANAGFRVNTQENTADAMFEVLSSKDVIVSITILLSYIRYCINRGIKKDITVKIGYNKPPSMPMNFALNDEMIDEIYPGDTIDIN